MFKRTKRDPIKAKALLRHNKKPPRIHSIMYEQ